MGEKIKNGGFILFIICGIFLIAFPFNSWFSSIMFRHQVLQMFLSLVIGLIIAWRLKKLRIADVYWGTSALIFCLFCLCFWMIPHTVDLAVVYPNFSRLMVINMALVGFLVVLSLRKSYMELKMAFLGMVTAMLFASGITLHSINVLVCSSFNVKQQHQTGVGLLYIAGFLLILTFVVFFNGLSNAKRDDPLE